MEPGIAIFALIYILCGILTYGITFAYFQRGWPSISELTKDGDRGFALALSLCGPLGLIVALIRSGFGLKYGIKYR